MSYTQNLFKSLVSLEKKLRRYVGENLILDDAIIFLFIIIGKNIRK